MNKAIWIMVAALLLAGSTQSWAEECNQLRIRSVAVKSDKLYSDVSASVLTNKRAILTTARDEFHWGVINTKPLQEAQFAAVLMSGKRKYENFRSRLHVDAGVKVPLQFVFRDQDAQGRQLFAVSVVPGETRIVDFPIAGVAKVYVAALLTPAHGQASKLVIGEPEFYSCRGVSIDVLD